MTKPVVGDGIITPLPRRCKFRIKLECGHWIKARNPPLNHKAKYGCTAGLGCGYQLNWTEIDEQKEDHG